MTETLLNGLMMDDYPLSLTAVVERAELLSASRKVVHATAEFADIAAIASRP